jgi:hypothetical protein
MSAAVVQVPVVERWRRPLLLVMASLDGAEPSPLAIHNRREGDEPPGVGARCTFFIRGAPALGHVNAVDGDVRYITVSRTCERCGGPMPRMQPDIIEKLFLCQSCLERRRATYGQP